MTDPVDGVKSQASDASSASLPQNPQTPAPGQASDAAAGKDGKTQTDPTNQNAGKADPKPLEIKDEDLDSRLLSKDQPEHTLESLRRDYAASSKEAIRLNKANAKLKEMLAEQGIDIAEEDGLPAGLLAGKSYSKDVKDLAIKVKDLSEAEQQMFGDNPQGAIDLILSRAKKALTRVAPTLESFTKPISAEREQSAIEHVKSLEEDGVKAHPAFDKNLAFIRRILDSKSTPKGLKDAYHQDPEFVLKLLSRHVDSERAALLSIAKREFDKKNNPSPPLGPSSGKTPGSSGAEITDPRVKGMVEAMGNHSL